MITSDYVKRNSGCKEFSTDESWIILSPIEQQIKDKIEKIGVPLRDWEISINYGIKTGYNDAFIISGEKKDEILQNCKSEEERQRTAELIRPILRGRDIKRYCYNNQNLWLIFIPWHFPLQNDSSIMGCSEKAETEFKKQYPSLYCHISQHKLALSMRNKAETGIRYEWYALQRWGANYWEDFSKQKIVYREISDAMNACLVDSNIMLNNKCYMITGEHLIYLLLIFNSKLFNKIILQQANTTGGKGEAFLNVISIPIPDAKLEGQFQHLYTRLVDNTLSKSKRLELESEIDYEICQLFKLTENERKFILS